MNKMKIDFDKVYTPTQQMRNYISNNLANEINDDYRKLQRTLDSVDSQTNAILKDGVELHLQKSLKTLQTIDRLLSFIEESANLAEEQEKNMADKISSKNKKGGMK